VLCERNGAHSAPFCLVPVCSGTLSYTQKKKVKKKKYLEKKSISLLQTVLSGTFSWISVSDHPTESGFISAIICNFKLKVWGRY